MCEIEVAISEENELPQCGATRLRGGRLSSEYCGGRNFALPQDCLRKQTCSTRPPVNKKWYHTHSRKHTLARTNTRIHTLVSNWILTSCRNTHTHTRTLPLRRTELHCFSMQLPAQLNQPLEMLKPGAPITTLPFWNIWTVHTVCWKNVIIYLLTYSQIHSLVPSFTHLHSLACTFTHLLTRSHTLALCPPTPQHRILSSFRKSVQAGKVWIAWSLGLSSLSVQYLNACL